MTAKEHWDSLNKNQKRYLKRFVCGWCERCLSSNECIDIMSPCSDEKLIEKRNNCLKNYKPRKKKEDI